MSEENVCMMAIYDGVKLRKFFRSCAFMHETAMVTHRRTRDDGPFKPKSDEWWVVAGDWVTWKIQSGMDWVAGMDDIIIPTVSEAKIEETAMRYEKRFFELSIEDPGKAFGYWDFRYKQREADHEKIKYIIACEIGHQNAMGIAAGVAGKTAVLVKASCDLILTFALPATGVGFLLGVGYAAATGVASATVTRKVSDASIGIGINGVANGVGALGGGGLEKSADKTASLLQDVQQQRIKVNELKAKAHSLEGRLASESDGWSKAATAEWKLAKAEMKSGERVLTEATETASHAFRPGLLAAAGKVLITGAQIFGTHMAITEAMSSWKQFDSTVEF